MGPSEEEPIQEAEMEGTSFFKIYQDAILHQGHLAAWLCGSFQGRHHCADLLARVIQVSGLTCTAVLTFFIPPRFVLRQGLSILQSIFSSLKQ